MTELKRGANSALNIPASNSLVLTAGYKTKEQKGIQLDLMAIVLDKNQKPKHGGHDFFFYGTGLYNNIGYGKGHASYNGVLEMLDFNVEGQEQKIKINFDKIPDDVEKIIFLQTVFNADNNRTSFNQVHDSYFRLEDENDRNNSISYTVEDTLNNVTCLQLCEIYRYNGVFKVRALGQGYSKGIKAALRDYSFELE